MKKPNDDKKKIGNRKKPMKRLEDGSENKRIHEGPQVI